jgi:DNA polymerase III subunit delta
MSVSSQKTLLTALKSQRFDGVYYITGEDTFQQEDAVRKLIQSNTDVATRDFNLDVRNAVELSAAVLDGLLGTPPMMAARRVIVIRDVHQLKRDARKTLDRYLERPSPDVLLLLLGNAESKVDSALSKATTPLIFDFLTPDRIPRWIGHYAKESLSTDIAPDAVKLLHQAVGEDLQQLATELDKLVSYTSGGEIDEKAVTAIVGVRTGELVGPFLDAVGARDSVRALEMVPGVLSQPKMSAVTIVMTLATQFLAVAWSRARGDSGLSRARLPT